MRNPEEKSGSELERERIQDLSDRFDKSRSRPLIYALSKLLVVLAHAIIASLMLSLIFQSFVLNGQVGVRSLAASALPPLIITYLNLYNRSFRPSPNLSKTFLYFAAALWMMAMLLLINYLSNYYPGYGMPLGVLLLSTTLSGLIFLNKHIPFPSSLSCSFGIVTGLLVYTLLFGIPSNPGF